MLIPVYYWYMTHKQYPKSETQDRGISCKAYIPDKALRILARMIANDIIRGLNTPNTTVDGPKLYQCEEIYYNEERNE